MTKQAIKSGDTVKVIAGDNKGKVAKVVSVDREANKACLEDIEVRERHIRASMMNPKGSKKTIHLGIDLSNLKLEKAGEPRKSAKTTAKKTAKKGDK